MQKIELFTIGQISEISGVSVDTIRFYEGEGLLKPSHRTVSGYRKYRRDAADKLNFINRAKELGFSLREIGELLSLEVKSIKTCSAVMEKAEAKLIEVESKVQDLLQMKQAIEELIRSCKRNRKAKCPLISSLTASNGL